MNENMLAQRTVNVLSEIEGADAQTSMDFTEKRTDNMIVVGITSTAQLNEGCGVPDYEHTMEILIDCSIPEDDSADAFWALIAEVKRRLLPFELKRSELPVLFGDLPVVFFEFISQTFTTSERSNQCTLRYRIITSY